MNDFNLNNQENHDQFKTILLVISTIKQSMEQNIKLLNLLANKIEGKVSNEPPN